MPRPERQVVVELEDYIEDRVWRAIHQNPGGDFLSVRRKLVDPVSNSVTKVGNQLAERLDRVEQISDRLHSRTLRAMEMRRFRPQLETPVWNVVSAPVMKAMGAVRVWRRAVASDTD